MKLRSTLLIACLIVVPLLAMVSHKIPAATRSAMRRCLWSPILGQFQQTAELTGVPGTIAATPSTPVSTDVRDTLPLTVPDRAGSAATEPTAPDRAPAESPPAEPPSGRGVEGRAAAPPPARPALLDAGSSLAIGVAGGRESLEARLRALGATRIDWTPAQGGDGLHRCSCRIPAEPTGQLHRVFQAAAADPLAALDNLVGQVTAWSMRGGATPGRDAGAGVPTSLRR